MNHSHKGIMSLKPRGNPFCTQKLILCIVCAPKQWDQRDSCPSPAQGSSPVSSGVSFCIKTKSKGLEETTGQETVMNI